MKKQILLLLVASAVGSVDAAASRLSPAARSALYSGRQVFQSALPKNVSNIAKQNARFRTFGSSKYDTVPANREFANRQFAQSGLMMNSAWGQFRNWFNNIFTNRSRVALATGAAASGGGAAAHGWLKDLPSVYAQENVIVEEQKPIYYRNSWEREERDKKELNEIKKILSAGFHPEGLLVIYTIFEEVSDFDDKIGWQLRNPQYGYGAVSSKWLFDEIYERIKRINSSNELQALTGVIVPKEFREVIRQIALQAPAQTKKEFLTYLHNTAWQNPGIAKEIITFFNQINPQSAAVVNQITGSKNVTDPNELANVRELIARTKDSDVIDFLITDRARKFAHARASPITSRELWTEAYKAYAYHELNQGKNLLEVLSVGNKIPPQGEGLYLVQFDDKPIFPYFHQIVHGSGDVVANMKRDRNQFFEKISRGAL